MVVERDILVERSGIDITGIFRSDGAGGVRLPKGFYRLRIHARGRAIASRHNLVETALETHLIQLWPSPEGPQEPEVLRGPDEYATRFQ